MNRENSTPGSIDDGETDHSSQTSGRARDIFLRTKGRLGIFIQQEERGHITFGDKKLERTRGGILPSFLMSRHRKGLEVGCQINGQGRCVLHKVTGRESRT